MTIEFPLSLTHGEPGPVKGWLLPGTDASAWVRTLCAMEFPGVGELPLFPIPRSAKSREVAGLFVPLPNGKIAVTEMMPRPLAYRLLGGRLYVPANAELRFPLTEGEFSSLFLHDVTVFLPGTGLVGYEAEDAVRMADLISLPEQRGQLWNFAHPGLLPLPEKLTIRAGGPPPDFVEMMRESRGDIGEQAGEGIPKYKGEPKASGGLRESFFEAVRGFARRFPESDKVKDPTWVNRMEDWANSNLQEKQNREIDRLLHWLEEDPDKGLRFALPIGGEGTRGFMPPNSKLRERKIDFDLNELNGGLPAAPWTLDWAQTGRLMTAYRDAANRELTLGRYRRAAYIYARLLGDYAAAANTLKSGGSYREAAQLYGTFLKDQRMAAECLKEGGLFEEALQLYHQLQEYETMGDLYRELGREKEAGDSYERAVNALQSLDRPTMAAKLIAEKLEDPDRALDLLFASWPYSREATEALSVYFQLCEAADESERALASLAALRDTEVRPSDTRGLAEVMADVAREGWSQALRDLAADSTRVVVGRQLERWPNEDARPLTKIIASLDDNDRLLKRDARRFGAANATEEVVTAPVPGKIDRVKLVEKSRKRLLPEFHCCEAIAFGDGLVGVGKMSGENSGIYVVKHSAQGAESYAQIGPDVAWKDVALVPDQHPASGGTPCVRVVSRFDFELEPRGFEQYESREPFGIHPLKPEVVGAAQDGLGGRWELRLTEAEFVLDRRHHVGKLSSSHHLTPMPPGLTAESVIQSGMVIPMALCGKGLFFAMANRLAYFRGDETQWLPMPGTIQRLVPTSPATLPRLAVALSAGAGLIWGDRNWRDIVFFAHESRDPFIAFTRSGFVAVVDEARIQVYSIKKKGIELAASMANPVGKPVAVLQGAVAGQFRLLTGNEIVTYELEAGG
tara:strand:+ start:8134 stop:10866 length:2733 start_codon:yes stop_codon:yes gene_type:complete